MKEGVQISYHWINRGKRYQVSELGKSLKAQRFIQGRISDFEKIFYGQTPEEKIKWVGDAPQINLLYLFYLLWENKCISKPKQPFIHLISCFELEDSQITKENLNSIKSTFSKIKLGKIRVKREEHIKKIIQIATNL